jgi:hypothetical protein
MVLPASALSLFLVAAIILGGCGNRGAQPRTDGVHAGCGSKDAKVKTELAMSWTTTPHVRVPPGEIVRVVASYQSLPVKFPNLHGDRQALCVVAKHRSAESGATVTYYLAVRPGTVHLYSTFLKPTAAMNPLLKGLIIVEAHS